MMCVHHRRQGQNRKYACVISPICCTGGCTHTWSPGGQGPGQLLRKNSTFWNFLGWSPGGSSLPPLCPYSVPCLLCFRYSCWSASDCVLGALQFSRLAESVPKGSDRKSHAVNLILLGLFSQQTCSSVRPRILLYLLAHACSIPL